MFPMRASLVSIQALIILDSSGKRVLAHYYDKEALAGSVQDQKEFEKKLFRKTKKTNVEILIQDGLVVVYKPSVDLYFYVVGARGENELMLQAVLNCFYDSLAIILRKEVEKRHLFQNLGTVMLAIDEICDKGVLLECDPHQIARRVVLKTTDDGEQTVSQVFNNYKEQLKLSLLR